MGTIGEKFVEGMARVNASFLAARVFKQEDLVMAALMTLPWKKDVLSSRLFSDHLHSPGPGVSQGFGGTAVLAHFLMYL